MKKIISLALLGAIMATTAVSAEGDYSIKRFPGQREYTQKYRNLDFRDIRNHWSKEAVYTIGALGMVKGMGGGIYAPSEALTKEQTLLFISRIIGVEGEAQRVGLEMSANRDTGGRYSNTNHHYTVVGTLEVLEGLGILVPEDIENIAPITKSQREKMEAEIGREVDTYRDGSLREEQIENIESEIRARKEREYRWQRPASREVVAYWLGRAVSEGEGIRGDSQQAINTFADWKSINGRYAPYIEEVLQKGLMVGSSGNRFEPKSSITRAEMAQILYNAHLEQLESQNYLIEQGKVLDIRFESGVEGDEAVRRRIIKVQTQENDIVEFYGQISKNGNRDYQRGMVTYIDGRLRDHQDIREGQYLQYYIKPSGEVAFAKQLQLQPETISGKVIGLYENMILIEGSNEELQRFRLAEEVDFKVNDRWTEMENLIPGMSGKFKILNGNIIGIDITVDEGGIGGGGNIAVGDYFHTGTVVSTSNNSRELTIARDKLGQNIETYDLESYPNLPIYRDGSKINFAGIRDGDFLRVYFSDLEGTIEKIELKSFRNRSVENIYKGSISHYNRNRNQIRLDYASRINGVSNWEGLSEETTLQISDNVDMYVTDSTGTTDILISRDTFEDYGNYKQQQSDYIDHALNQDQDIYLYTERVNGREEITRIVLRQVGEYKFSGVVESLSNGVIAMPSNQNIYYNNSTMVLKEGRLIHPSSLSEGDTITVYTHDGRNTAAVVIVEGENISDYPYTVYSTRLSGINVTRQTVEVSGTGSQKVRGTSVTPFPFETLNLPTDAVVQVIEVGKRAEVISTERFLSRYYGDFEYSNVKIVTDNDQNIIMLQIYSDELNRPELNDIRSARVKSKNLSSERISLSQIRTWTGSSWTSGVGEIELDFSNAIFIVNGRSVRMDRVRDGSSVDVIGDINVGHVLIVR